MNVRAEAFPDRGSRCCGPLFRYSRSRQDHVLRIVGRRFGPVLVERSSAGRRRQAATVPPKTPEE